MTFFAVMFALFLIPLAAIMDGWVLTKLWAWFVVPTFDVAPLGLVPAIGLSIIVTYLIHGVKSDEKDKEKKDEAEVIFTALGKLFIVPLVYLGFGWIVSSFM